MEPKPSPCSSRTLRAHDLFYKVIGALTSSTQAPQTLSEGLRVCSDLGASGNELVRKCKPLAPNRRAIGQASDRSKSSVMRSTCKSQVPKRSLSHWGPRGSNLARCQEGLGTSAEAPRCRARPRSLHLSAQIPSRSSEATKLLECGLRSQHPRPVPVHRDIKTRPGRLGCPSVLRPRCKSSLESQLVALYLRYMPARHRTVMPPERLWTCCIRTAACQTANKLDV